MSEIEQLLTELAGARSGLTDTENNVQHKERDLFEERRRAEVCVCGCVCVCVGGGGCVCLSVCLSVCLYIVCICVLCQCLRLCKFIK
jgi:hypothetical protein